MLIINLLGIASHSWGNNLLSFNFCFSICEIGIAVFLVHKCLLRA